MSSHRNPFWSTCTALGHLLPKEKRDSVWLPYLRDEQKEHLEKIAVATGWVGRGWMRVTVVFRVADAFRRVFITRWKKGVPPGVAR
jgi:hypothetical protein